MNDSRRAALGRLRIANEGGLPVDVAYKEMQQMAPELFPAGITHPADQLMRMFEVSKRIEKVQMSLDQYHGEDAAGIQVLGKERLRGQRGEHAGALNVARRYAEARMRQQQARGPSPRRWRRSKRRETSAACGGRMSGRRQEPADGGGQQRPESPPARRDHAGGRAGHLQNAQGILAMYEAKADYDAAAAKIADNGGGIRSKFASRRDNLLKMRRRPRTRRPGSSTAGRR